MDIHHLGIPQRRISCTKIFFKHADIQYKVIPQTWIFSTKVFLNMDIQYKGIPEHGYQVQMYSETWISCTKVFRNMDIYCENIL